MVMVLVSPRYELVSDSRLTVETNLIKTSDSLASGGFLGFCPKNFFICTGTRIRAAKMGL